jgi:hypothetical protein
MRSSVIIPSFRSSATIRDCLTTVLAQELGDPFEVLVADSGGDGTAEIVSREFPGVRLLKSATRMSAELARNWGAREATGSVLAFIVQAAGRSGLAAPLCAPSRRRNGVAARSAAPTAPTRRAGPDTSASFASSFLADRRSTPRI